MVAEWHRQALRHPNALSEPDDEDAAPRENYYLLVDNLRLALLIAKRYSQRHELMSIHQYELTNAERRLRQAIELVFEVLDRRRGREVHEAEVIVEHND